MSKKTYWLIAGFAALVAVNVWFFTVADAQGKKAASVKSAESKPSAATATFKGPVSTVGTLADITVYGNPSLLTGTASESKWRNLPFRQEPPKRCVETINRLPGVEKAFSISRYSIDVQIGQKFTWQETTPAIEKALKQCGLEP